MFLRGFVWKLGLNEFVFFRSFRNSGKANLGISIFRPPDPKIRIYRHVGFGTKGARPDCNKAAMQTNSEAWLDVSLHKLTFQANPTIVQ